MKQIFTLSSIFICFSAAFSQHAPLESGGGEFVLESSADKCLSDIDRSEIKMRLRENAALLIAEGKLSPPSGDREDVKFIWPLQKADGFEWNSYYGISNFVDQNTSVDFLGDYHCDERTYDGHYGTDIFTWPFPWHMYANNLVEVIAGESGVIIEKDDGFEDDHCECYGSWNAVYVQHEDGSVAWYGHLKKESLTTKEVGDAVVAGEYLGIVASSGCSTGPHLHLEVYDAESNLIDPYAGDCNDLNADSWWEIQPENRAPQLNVLLTHDAVPEQGCPEINEDPHMQNDFYPGDVLYTAFYFHDALAGSVGNYRLRMPDGTVWQDWSSTSPETYNASWWYWSWDLPDAGPFGVWTLEADFAGETLIHEFNYGVYAANKELHLVPITFSPNPTNTGEIYLSKGVQNMPVQIYDSTGKLLMDEQLTGQRLNLNHLAKGMYIAHFELNGQLYKQQIVLN